MGLMMDKKSEFIQNAGFKIASLQDFNANSKRELYEREGCYAVIKISNIEK